MKPVNGECCGNCAAFDEITAPDMSIGMKVKPGACRREMPTVVILMTPQGPSPQGLHPPTQSDKWCLQWLRRATHPMFNKRQQLNPQVNPSVKLEVKSELKLEDEPEPPPMVPVEAPPKAKGRPEPKYKANA